MSAVFSTRSFQAAKQSTQPAGALWMNRARTVLGSGLAAIGSAVAARRRVGIAPALRDESTGLLNRSGFLEHGGHVLEQARRNGRALAFVVFDFADLREVRAIYGAHIAARLVRQITNKLKAVGGAHAEVARTGKWQFAVLLPGQSQERALDAVHRVLGYPARIELDSDGEEIVLMPDVLADNIAAGDEPLAQLHRELLRELDQQRARELRRCNYLQRERERHSRPMALHPLPEQTFVPAARYADTVPLPVIALR